MLFFKMSRNVCIKVLRGIYHCIFHTYLFYSSLVWVVNLQNNAANIMNSQRRNPHICSLFKQSSILKVQYSICSIIFYLPANL